VVKSRVLVHTLKGPVVEIGLSVTSVKSAAQNLTSASKLYKMLSAGLLILDLSPQAVQLGLPLS